MGFGVWGFGVGVQEFDHARDAQEAAVAARAWFWDGWRPGAGGKASFIKLTNTIANMEPSGKGRRDVGTLAACDHPECAGGGGTAAGRGER